MAVANPMSVKDITAEFFGGPGPVSIEARDSSGEQAPAMSRRVTQALAGARTLMLTAMVGLGSLGAIQAAQAKDVSALSPLTESQSIEIVRQTIGDKIPFTLTNAEQGEIKGPSAVLVKAASGEANCSVSLNRLDSNAWIMASGMDPASAERMREFTVRHEAAHCVFFSRLGVPDAGGFSLKEPSAMTRSLRIGESGLVSGDQFELLDQLGAATLKKTGVAAMGDSLLLKMISEGYADANAALSLAKKTVGRAGSPSEAKIALKAFDAYIDDAYSFRNSLGDSDPTHDSSSMLAHIKSMVHAKAATAEGLSELKTGILSDAHMDATALQWSTGSALSRSDHLSRTMLKAVMESLPDDESVLPKEAKQDLRDLIKAKPQALAAIASGAGLGLKPEDFHGGARVLADQALRSFKDLSSYAPIAMPGLEASSGSSVAQGAPDALQVKLNSAGAMVGRMFSAGLLNGHAGHAHHHDEPRRSTPSMRLR